MLPREQDFCNITHVFVNGATVRLLALNALFSSEGAFVIDKMRFRLSRTWSASCFHQRKKEHFEHAL